MVKQRINIAPQLDGQVWPFLPRQLPQRELHRHDEPEFNFITRGTAGYLVDGQRYEVARHTLIWLMPGQDHLLIDESRDFEMWIAVFRMPMLRRLVKAGCPRTITTPRLEPPFCHHLTEPHASQLADMLTHSHAAKKDAPLFNAWLSTLAMTAWRMHEQAQQSPQGQAVHPCVRQAAELIRQSPQEADFQDIAQTCGLSLSRLTRLFKQQMGVAMVHFRQRERLRRFMLLQSQRPSLNMTQAALQAGFGSYPQFHRVFRQIHGCSPQVFERIVRQANPSGQR